MAKNFLCIDTVKTSQVFAFEMKRPTCVDESSWCAFAKLFGFIGKRDLYHPRDVTRRGLNSDCMRCDELRGENEIERGH